MIAATENPFERVPLQRITGTVKVSPEARQAQILSVNVPKLKFRPGETVKAFVTYRPFRAAEGVLPVNLELPRDLPDGPYQLVISDWQRYFADEIASQPFRFSAESSNEVFDVIRDFTAIRHDAIYARLMRQADGVAVGRIAMPRLPSSRRQVLLGAGRSNTTAFVSSSCKTIPSEFVMEGSADFILTIDFEAHVEVGGKPNATKTEPASSPPQTAVNPTEEKEKKANKSDKSDKENGPSGNPERLRKTITATDGSPWSFSYETNHPHHGFVHRSRAVRTRRRHLALDPNDRSRFQGGHVPQRRRDKSGRPEALACDAHVVGAKMSRVSAGLLDGRDARWHDLRRDRAAGNLVAREW